MRLACHTKKQCCKHDVAFALELHVPCSERRHAVSQLRHLLPVPILTTPNSDRTFYKVCAAADVSGAGMLRCLFF